MSDVNQLVGKKFGRLTVLRITGSTEDHNRDAGCMCECGTPVIARVDNLRAGKTKSCGCIASDLNFKKALLEMVVEHGFASDVEAYQNDYLDLLGVGEDEEPALYSAPAPKGASGMVRMSVKRHHARSPRFDKDTGRLLISGYGSAQKRYVPYRLEPGEYERRLVEQNGVCNICVQPPANGRELVVDHCHETGRVRGLLCYRCNIGLGAFKDDFTTLARALKHLAPPV